MKKCFKCEKEKPETDFYKHPEMADGRLGKCKECAKKDVSKNYSNSREYYAEYERRRFKDPHRKGNIAIYQRRRRENHPQKYKCNTFTSNAIRDKRLIRQPCVTCGADKVEAHHEDYDKPLEVIWLCRKHHLKEHGKMSYKF